MRPITLNLRADNEPPADAPVDGELSSAELDANWTNTRTACNELASETALLGGGRPLRVGFAGDSIADFMGQRDEISALYWAATEIYPCEYESVVDTGLGGSSSSNLISAQIAVLEAAPVKPDVVFVQSVQNDGLGSQANADTYFAY
jgi:hypothetical protein